jgi:hypothetical protein
LQNKLICEVGINISNLTIDKPITIRKARGWIGFGNLEHQSYQYTVRFRYEDKQGRERWNFSEFEFNDRDETKYTTQYINMMDKRKKLYGDGGLICHFVASNFKPIGKPTCDEYHIYYTMKTKNVKNFKRIIIDILTNGRFMLVHPINYFEDETELSDYE